MEKKFETLEKINGEMTLASHEIFKNSGAPN